jgi:hypothetical protein
LTQNGPSCRSPTDSDLLVTAAGLRQLFKMAAWIG